MLETVRSARPRRRLLLSATIVGLAITLLLSVSTAAGAATAQGPAEGPVVRTITFPVVGPTVYSDTWGACRGLRCSRSHLGVDIFAAKLAPLVAATDGVISSVRRTALTSAGNKIVVTDDEGWRYIYLHLNNDSPGTDDGANPQGWIIPDRLRVGDRVTAGQVIGYLGDSGNAERTPNHLHFEIRKPGAGAVNPTPSVVQAQRDGRIVPTSSLASDAAGRAVHEGLIAAWYRALLKREPTPSELFAWADRFAVGLGGRDDLIADLTMAPQRYGPAGTVLRAYHVVVDRRPAIGELRSSEQGYRDGMTTTDIVAALLGGAEFNERHGPLDDEAFIELIYRNARGTAPTASVRQYWLDQLGGGRPRPEMASYFVDSYGLKDSTWHDLEVQQAFRAALDRLPTDDEFNRWVAHLDQGGLIVDIVDGIKN